MVSRFASLLLLPLYTHYLQPGDYGRVENLTALVAVAVTIAQLGMVNALFRFALERQGEARGSGDAHGDRLRGIPAWSSRRSRRSLTPIAAPHPARAGEQSLWLLSCVGLWISLVYEPTVGLYRVEQRPTRYLADHDRQRRRSPSRSQPVLVISLSDKAFGLVAGSYTGTAVALVVVRSTAASVLYGRLDRAVLRPDAPLRAAVHALASRAVGRSTCRTACSCSRFSTQAAVGVLALGVRIGKTVALMVTAFQLAWPPFAYSIEDDEEARRVYRAVLT